MKKNILVYSIIAISFGALGFFMGADRSYNMGSKSSQAGSLNWLCMIHGQIEKGDTQQASRIAEAAIAAHVFALRHLESATGTTESTPISEASAYILKSDVELDSKEAYAYLESHNQ